ncbi:hypothetical protein ABVK25_011885 [Lepraria finkii]|uniref:Uncharacterized protein n=1 Tax=Lepraria finkii TaxID=1340010 RepID=A0ABR4AJM0_9LECA
MMLEVGPAQSLLSPKQIIYVLQLWCSSPQPQSLIGPNAQLRFLAFVDIPSIPLYFAAGPSLNVTTDDDQTTAWLSDNLLARQFKDGLDDALGRPWGSDMARQSEQGILLRVEDEGSADEGSVKGTYDGITDILLYASVVEDRSSLPTPPRLSSPVPPEDSV